MSFRLARFRSAATRRAPLLLGCAVVLTACGPEGAGTVDMSKARQAKGAPAAKPNSPAAAKAPAKAPTNPSERLSPRRQ